MVTHANTEMAVTKADVFTHSPLEADLARHAVPHGEAPGLARRHREGEGNVGKSFYCGVPGKEWVKQSKQN